MKFLLHLKDVIAGKHPIGSLRSTHWPKVREDHLKIQPCCQLCGGTKNLNVHHIHPFHIKPELELDPTNLITLCESSEHGVNCHLWFGHLGNFKNVNEDVVNDTKVWNEKLKNSQISKTP
jgi:hypothetical protein